MAVTLRHNKYSSMPDWFGTQSTETATTTSTTQPTNNVLQQTITTATSVDFNNIPIDGQTIVWNNDTLGVPIDNQKIILVDGKLTTSDSTNSTDPVTEMLWELRQLTDGTNYIYTPFPVVTQLGVTMYSSENVSVAYVNEDESRIKKLEDEVENLKKEIEIIKQNIAYGS